MMLRVEREKLRERRRRIDRSGAPMLDGAAGAIFEALRKWRSEEARGQHVPPYVIFADAVLREIALFRPGNLDELSDVKGVGASKLARYGAAVLNVVRAN